MCFELVVIAGMGVGSSCAPFSMGWQNPRKSELCEPSRPVE